MINFYLVNNPLTKDDKNDFRAQVINQEAYTEDDLANDLVEYNLGISKPQALATIEAFNEILKRQIKKGSNISLKLINFHFTIPGSFKEKELPSHAELRATATKEASDIAKTVSIKHVETPEHIRVDFVHDVKTDTVNDKITQFGNVKIGGHNIKIAGTDPSVGIEFHSLEDPESVYKILPRDIIVNNPCELIIVAPKMVDNEEVVLKITTQFSSNILKTPRSVTFDRKLTVV
jgi:nucleoid DNA-binding protein